MPDNGCSAEIKGQTAGNLSLSHWSDCYFPCLGKYKRVIGWGRGISPTVKPPLNYWRQACKVSVKIITTLFNYVLSSYVRQLRSEVEKQNSALIYDSHFFLARARENGARELPEIRSGGGKGRRMAGGGGAVSAIPLHLLAGMLHGIKVHCMSDMWCLLAVS